MPPRSNLQLTTNRTHLETLALFSSLNNFIVWLLPAMHFQRRLCTAYCKHQGTLVKLLSPHQPPTRLWQATAVYLLTYVFSQLMQTFGWRPSKPEDHTKFPQECHCRWKYTCTAIYWRPSSKTLYCPIKAHLKRVKCDENSCMTRVTGDQ